MMSRGKGFNHGHDWDPMKDDFDNSNYDRQYADDDAGDLVHLDHCRLYITNIPKGLNEDGLRAAFAKYGTLEEAYVSKDPNKRYGLVSYETSGEAKLAMMKLNRTEPLRLNICVAHKKKQNVDTKKEDRRNRGWDRSARDRDDEASNGMRERASNMGEGSSHTRRERDDASVTSRGRHTRRDDMANGDNNVTMDDLPVDMEDDLGLEALDPELQLELDRLQLEHLKLQQAQLLCKQRMLLKQAERRALIQNTPSNRCVLPGGKIVIRNVTDGNNEPRDGDSCFTAGAGDSRWEKRILFELKIPGLQRAASRACVACGSGADAYCSRCGVTPYCSARCQRRDWADRHKAVCHNLARLAAALDVADVEPVATPPAPLRRPHSPGSQRTPSATYNQRDNNRREIDDFGTDSGHKKYPPPANKPYHPNQVGGSRNSRANGGGSVCGRNFNSNSRPQNDGRDERRPMKQRDTDDVDFGSKGLSRIPYRRNYRVHYQEDETYWGTPPQPEPVESKPSPQPESKPVPKAEPEVLPKPLQQYRQEPIKAPEKVKPAQTQKPPASVACVTPVRKLVPKKCVIETLSVGDMVLLSVDSAGRDCRAGGGFVCLSMHERCEEAYGSLCEDYGVQCEADSAAYTLTPGDTFSYFNAEESAWYRCRCLTPSLGALLDSSRVVPLAASDKYKRLPSKYEDVPEFCCLLTADVQLGNNLKVTLLAKTAKGYKVSIENVETGAACGEGEVSRWLPEVEYPSVKPLTPDAAPAQAVAPLVLPEVSRPEVVNNSKVFLVDLTELDRAFVRPADTASQKAFDGILEDVVLYGRNATPVKEPPQRGQIVIGKFIDGLHYRALVKRTNVKQNKYMLEYIEYGNIYVTTLEEIFPCPQEMGIVARPTLTSQVTLQTKRTDPLTPPATQYLDKLKDDTVELILSLPSDAKTAASGSPVILTVAKNNDVVNRKVEEMCTPEWKKIEDKGGDVVVDSEVLMYGDLEHLALPADGCELDVLDLSSLHTGALGACQRGLPHAAHVFDKLQERMAQYCNSEIGRQPYLPKPEELCIAQCPPYPQWFRAVFLEQISGAGGSEAQVCYIDYGNVEIVPVSLLRKMLPEFVRGLPAVANTIVVNNFPKDPSTAQLSKAIEFMNVNDDGRGVLRVTRCVRDDDGMYNVDAPDLIAALKG